MAKSPSNEYQQVMPFRSWVVLLFLTGCDSEQSLEPFAAEGTLGTIEPTVLTVAWTHAGEGAVISAEWGDDDAYGHSVLLGTGDAGLGVLVGMHPSATVHWRVVTDSGETTPDEVVKTGFAPGDLPLLSVDVVGDTTGGLSLTSTLDSFNAYAVAFDHEGYPVWWAESGDDEGPYTDVRPSPDGRGVIYQTTDPKLIDDIALVTFRAWNGDIIETTRTPNGHHDFVILPDGSYGFCMIDVREADVGGTPMSVVGDAIGEMPAGGDPERDLRVVWSSWDALPMRAKVEGDTGFYSMGLDWTHCNGLAFEPDRGKYLVSMYAIGSVAQVDQTTGNTDWVLGGEDGTLTVPDGEGFSVAHSPEPLEGGLRLFNNRAPDPLHSRVLEYTIDEAAGSAHQVESIDLDGQYFSYILGDSNALPVGHLLISWGSSGLLTEVDADRTVVWQAGLPLGAVIGFSSDVQVPGQPQP